MGKYLDKTGLTYLWGKIKSLFVAKLGTRIPADSDLNNFVETGRYVCYAANASSIVNSPNTTIGAFMLDVKRFAETTTNASILCVQTFYPSTYSVKYFYQRKRYSTSGWDSWKKWDLTEYVALSGGTMTGDLTIDSHQIEIKEDWYPHLILKPTKDNTTNVSRIEGSLYGKLSMQTWNDDTGNNRRILELQNSSDNSSLTDSLVLREIKNGTENGNYKVFTTAGGTLTGQIELATTAGVGSEVIRFGQTAGSAEFAICKSDSSTTTRSIAFRQYQPSGTYRENYSLPQTTDDLTASVNYAILTTKQYPNTLLSYVVLASGYDLDTLHTPGLYYAGGSPQNAPSGNSNGFVLVIGSSSSTKQMWFRMGTVNSNDYQTFVRTYATSTGWGSWYTVFTSGNVIPKANGGTGCDNVGDTTAVNGSTISVENDTVTNLGSITLNPGVYIIQVLGHFVTNVTGYRQIGLSTSATAANADRYTMARIGAAADIPTDISFTVCRAPTEQTTYYANARQTSGGALNCYCGIRATKIAAN